MLKEVYVIAEGLNYFHYTTSEVQGDQDQPLLTSGFLSAIQSFSLETRDSSIESFTSQDELFLFTQLPDTNKLLICVFDKDANLNYANPLLNNLKRIVLNSYILNVKHLNKIDKEEDKKLWDAVHQAVQSSFSGSMAVEIAETSFKTNPSLALMLIYDLENKEALLHQARPERSITPQTLSELSLLLSTLKKLNDQLNLPDTEFITIDSRDFTAAIGKNEHLVSMAVGTKLSNPVAVKTATLTAVNLPGYDDFPSAYENLQNIDSWIIPSKGEIETVSGNAPPPLFDVFYSTFSNAETRLVNSVVKKKYHTTTIYSSIEKPTKFVINHKDPTEILYSHP